VRLSLLRQMYSSRQPTPENR